MWKTILLDVPSPPWNYNNYLDKWDTSFWRFNSKIKLICCCGADIYLHNYPAYITVDFPWTVHCLKLGDYSRHFLYFPDLCASSLKNKKQKNRLRDLNATFFILENNSCHPLTSAPFRHHFIEQDDHIAASCTAYRKRRREWERQRDGVIHLAAETSLLLENRWSPVGKESPVYLCRSSDQLHRMGEPAALRPHGGREGSLVCWPLWPEAEPSSPLKPFIRRHSSASWSVCSFQHFAWWPRKSS